MLQIHCKIKRFSILFGKIDGYSNPVNRKIDGYYRILNTK